MSSRSDLQAVFRSGNRRRTPRLDIMWSANDAGHPRLGIVVPRHGETAVARNRLRRRLREFVRRDILTRLPAVDMVIHARAAAYGARRGELTRDLSEWLRSITD